MNKQLIGFLAGIMVTASVIIFSAFKPDGENEYLIIDHSHKEVFIYSDNTEETIKTDKGADGTKEFIKQIKKYEQQGYTLISNTTLLYATGYPFGHSALLRKD